MSGSSRSGGSWLRLASQERRLALRQELVDALQVGLATGGNLPASLAEAAQDHPSQTVRRALRSLADDLASGVPLSDGLRRLAPLADDALVAAARTGERSGDLAAALSACERLVSVRLQLARAAADAILQPLLSIATAVATVCVLLLAGAVRALLDLSAGEAGERTGAVRAGLRAASAHPALATSLVLGAVAVIALGIRAAPATALGALLLDRLPLFGALRREARLGLACRQSSLLVSAGVPADEALALAADALPARASERTGLEDVVRLVRAGEPIPAAAAAAPQLPPVLRAVLEASSPARLADGLARAARWHEAEHARLADRARAAAAVAGSVAAGIACGGVVVLAWSGYFAALGNVSW